MLNVTCTKATKPQIYSMIVVVSCQCRGGLNKHSAVQERDVVTCTTLIPGTYVCVLMSGSELKASLPVSVWWHWVNGNIWLLNALHKTCLCSAADHWASVNQGCVCDMTDILVFTSASQPTWSTRCTLMQVCGTVFERATKPQNSAQETERLIEAELSECFLGNIRHTQSDQTSIHHHHHHHPNLALAVLLARGTPIISLTRWGWHVKWGCMARRCFVVYHKLKLQVLQLVWLSGTDGSVCVC